MKYPKRCQYKHAKQKKYHVRNWAEYNEGLRRRGDLTVWFDEEAIANWKADKTGKPGGQRVYSDMAIETGLVVRMVYKLAYRQTEGFLHSIASLLGLGIEIPVCLLFIHPRRPEPDRSPICRDYACMISSFVRARPWARPQTQTLSC